ELTLKRGALLLAEVTRRLEGVRVGAALEDLGRDPELREERLDHDAHGDDADRPCDRRWLRDDGMRAASHVVPAARGHVGEVGDERLLGGELLELVMNPVRRERASAGRID